MATEVAELTEAQIDALLQEAEERLTAKSSPAELAATNKIAQLSSTDSQIAVAAPAAKGKAQVQKTGSVDLYVPHLDNKKKEKSDPSNAGPDWYGLTKTKLTPEAKRDFQILRMRGVLDAKHHFRKDTRKDLIPKFSVFGTIVEGSMEGRLTRKERKRTITEEVLASQEANASFKKRYNLIQERKTQGKKAFYKKVVARRRRRP